MKTRKCGICGKEFKGYGNSAWPLKSAPCCDKCNKGIIIPIRFSIVNASRKEQ